MIVLAIGRSAVGQHIGQGEVVIPIGSASLVGAGEVFAELTQCCDWISFISLSPAIADAIFR
ncbi:MAG: hypothetical protein QOH31_5663 [Verrucomicrobiota bacterium]|jgi:hypothetical protein